MKKRYLIVYKKNNVSTKKAASLLGESKQLIEFNLKSGLMAEGNYHFPNLDITSAVLNESEANELKEHPEIDFIEEDSWMTTLGELSSAKSKVLLAGEDSWNMRMIKAPGAWKKGFTGKGVKLAILDTGIATHPDLSIKGGVSTVPNILSYNDDDGHGTHCAGIAAGLGVKPENVKGVAPDASLYAVKVLKKDSDGISRGLTSWIIAGMEWCVSSEMNVMSMSLGGKNNPSEAYAVAVKVCQEAGITVVCASGNSNQTDFPFVNSPANSCYQGLAIASPVAVGSVDSASTIAMSSSRGGKPGILWNGVGVVAPGVNIYSTYLNNRYVTMSGTSMACPHVAGLAALMAQKDKKLTPLQIKADILATASALGVNTPNETYGYGLINCEKATAII